MDYYDYSILYRCLSDSFMINSPYIFKLAPSNYLQEELQLQISKMEEVTHEKEDVERNFLKMMQVFS